MSQTELGSPDDSGANTVVPGDTSGSTSDLPSYAQLQQSEGPRFGRWHDWIEKRARERRELRAEEGLQPTSWDLPGVPGLQSARNQGAAPRSTDHAEARLSRPPPVTPRIVNPDPSQHSAEPLPPAKAGLVQGPHVSRLTASTSLHPISQRFLAQFPEDDEPLCAAPIRPQNATTDRYLLIGSLKGLWVCDLMPNLETSVRASSLEDSVIIQVWTGTVKQLEVCRQRRTVIAITPPLEDPLPPGSPASGSTSNFNISHPATGSDQVRVWPLQSLLNLVKYRTLAPQSSVVTLNVATGSSTSTSSHSTESTAREGKRASALLGLKRALSPNDSSDVKGKGRARTPSSASLTENFVMVSPQPSLTDVSSSSRKSATETHDLAEGWAQSSALLNLSRGHLPVLLVRLLMPPPSRLHYVAEESAYLAVTTKSAVYLYERKWESKRSWTEIREFYTPQAATGLDMVHFAADAVSDLYVGAHATQSHSRKPSSSLPSDSLAQHPTLSLFVRMKEKAVIIRLADSSVRELRLSERDQAQSHLGASMPTTGARSRKASFGRSNSRSSFLGRRGSFSGDHLREAIQATLKLGKSDDSWTSCERVDLGAKQLYLLVTKGHSTYMVPEPIASSSSTADITQSTSIQLLSVYTWRWRSSPSALHATATSLSSSSAVTTAKICLTAVTATGIEVHEGQANLSLLSTGGNVLWTPVVQAEAELEGYTSYDFGAVTKPLAPLQLPRFEADDQSTESNGGAGVVIAVQSVGEWRLKFVG